MISLSESSGAEKRTMVSAIESPERRVLRGSTSTSKLTNGNHNANTASAKSKEDVSDDDDDQMTAMLANAVKATRSTEFESSNKATNGLKQTHKGIEDQESDNRKRPAETLNSDQTSAPDNKKPRINEESKAEENEKKFDTKENSNLNQSSSDSDVILLSDEKPLSSKPNAESQTKNIDEDIIDETDEVIKKKLADDKEKSTNKSMQLAQDFCHKFCKTVEKNEKPVCAASDLRISDVFCRFVEHQCASSLAATIDVIKSTHVRFPSHISIPPSHVVSLVAQYEPATSIKQLRQELFANEPSPPLSETEKRDKLLFKNTYIDRAPAFGFCAYNMGLELVQEKVYRDVIDGKHMNFFSRGPQEYDKVCSQLKPILNNLIIKNKPYKIEEKHKCTRCKFHSSILSVVREHERRPHHNRQRFYVCAVCKWESQSRNVDSLLEHMLSDHQLVLLTNDEVEKTVNECKYPCPECSEQFSKKADFLIHLRDHKRFTKRAEIQHRQDPRNGITSMQFLWPRAQSEFAIARQSTSQHKPTTEAPLAGMTTMPNGVPAALCVQLGGPDGAFALIKRPIQNFTHSRFGPSFRTSMQQGIPPQQQRPQLTNIMPKPNQYASMGSGGGTSQTRPMLNASLLTKMSNIAAMTARGPTATQRAPMLSTARGRNTQTSHQLVNNRYNSAVTDEYAIKQLLSQCNNEQQSILSSKSYNCEICDTHVQGAWRYLRHMQQNHKQLERKVPQDMLSGPSLSCSKCMERFFSYEGLERHLVLVHSLVTGDLLAKAKARQDSGRCRMCSRMYAFNFLSHLVSEHQVKLCSAEILYSCDVCTFSCHSYRELDAHLQSKHPLATNTHSCELNNKQSARVTALSSCTGARRCNINQHESRNQLGRAIPSSASKMRPKPTSNRQSPKPAQKQKKGGLRYTCTPCALKFDKYDQVIRHWQRSHLKKISIPICRIDECDIHCERLKEQFDIDWTLPEEPPLASTKVPMLTMIGDNTEKPSDLNETITLE